MNRIRTNSQFADHLSSHRRPLRQPSSVMRRVVLSMVLAIIGAVTMGLIGPTHPIRAQETPELGDREKIAESIRQLDSDRFAQRQRASQQLYDAGQAAIPALLETARGSAKEAAQRAVDILKRFLQNPEEATQSQARAALEKIAADGSSPVAKAAEQALRPKPEAPAPPQAIPAPPLPRIQVGGIQKQFQFGGGLGGGSSKRVSIVDGVKNIEISEKGRKIKIVEDPAKGIEIEITETKDGKQETQKYEAKDADELKKKNADAHRLFEEHTKQGIQINGLPGIQIQQGILPPGGALPIDPEKLVEQLQQRGQSNEALDKALQQVRDAIEQLEKAQENPTKDDVSKALEKLQEARRTLDAIRGKNRP